MRHRDSAWPSSWWPVPCRRDRPSARLFCFPYAGGSSTDPIFREWASAMPVEIELSILEMPGRARRMAEPFEVSLQRLVQRLVPVFAACTDLPFVFFGHSLGAIVAYELARALDLARLPCPGLLLVSAKQAPHLPYTQRLFDLPRDRFVDALRELDGTPDEVFRNEELLELVVSVLRSDLEMAFNYRYAGLAMRKVPIIAFGGRDDPHVSVESVLAWEAHTGHFQSEIYPGGHFYLQKESKVAVRDRVVDIMRAFALDPDGCLEGGGAMTPDMRQRSSRVGMAEI